MADAVIYSSMDVDGPGLRPTLSSANSTLGGVERAYQILYPCLVSGYGSGLNAKPGQGWTLIHTDIPYGFTLKAPDGVFYVFCKGASVPASGNVGSNGFMVFMAESLSAPYTYPPTGVNVRSSDYSSNNPGAVERHWVTFSNASYPESNWFLVARGSQVLFTRMSPLWESLGGSNPSDSGSTQSSMYFFGNIVLLDPTAPRSGPMASVFQGGYSGVQTLTSTTSLYGNHLGDYALTPASSDVGGTGPQACTRLRNFLSGVVEEGALVKTSANPAKYTNTTMGRQAAPMMPAPLMLSPVDVWLSGVGSIGFIPGLFHGGRSCHYRTQDLLIALGAGSVIADCLNPVTIGGEPFYIIPTGYGSVIVSLQEKYW